MSRAHPVRLFQAGNPGKRATERFWLLYTPVWGAAAALVMVGGWATRWSDAQLLPFGVTLALGALLGPLLLPAPEERGRPLRELAAAKLGLSVVLFAILLNYFQTPFFWDVLHMHYGFRTRLNIQNNPVFLYFLTVAYFATYCALLNGASRVVRRRLLAAPRSARVAALAIVPFAVALLETVLNANPFMKSLFCYDDMPFMLWFGTLAYGTAFCFALPVWISIDEEPGQRVSLLQVVVWSFAAVLGNLICLEAYRHLVAPWFTTVVTGAHGLRDFGSSCLVPPPG